ncbi:HypC/HybG/HupF family hydrogenase formation chaperone [Veillonella sp. YH-vei2232]|jgi:hydrogenase expression/formation protein HypC|uniref:HypC/HybG/HupF family hydrogenase formation chaperone n=1 Tax=Veillonella absiana TaxID=3079305 RepID=A0ABU3Z916_9FIRM|nr:MULTISPECIES: HypC/HybG/HupF family hydrogenase formation chaperone [unclassified Veillonella]NCB96038.1 HypC/HybG/HupF family hydrogenase formation chaperone [Negativicutes bacterium]MBK7921769.1 HypC/HybG/HupF family hydrogenase formation chaperone [Veillonella sp.]MBP8616780.1 HypC/HybG/HupF family hydrogenase formation chaperone [Veillonella sp.]MBP9517057.1 HypC/HybG/HupF family hydrogenase formation chaperone [Veillonella sp.]MBP9551469.1 HypC/HybG/HupF family hydrogenase formation ch
MCLAVPAQLISINESIGTIELTGATRDCSLLLVPEAKVGDWLLVHAGFAVQIVDEEEAQATLEAFRELEELEEAYFAGKTANS